MDKKGGIFGGSKASWVFWIILGILFAVYAVYLAEHAIRHWNIERTEAPITGFSCGNYKKVLKSKNEGEDDEYNYYMYVFYNDKDYKVKIDEKTYKERSGGKMTLYYDQKGDDIFPTTNNVQTLILWGVGACVVIVLYFWAKRKMKKEEKKRS